MAESGGTGYCGLASGGCGGGEEVSGGEEIKGIEKRLVIGIPIEELDEISI